MRTHQRVVERLFGRGFVFDQEQECAEGRYLLNVVQDTASLTYSCDESIDIGVGVRVAGVLFVEKGALRLTEGPEILTLHLSDGRWAPFRVIKQGASEEQYEIELSGPITRAPL